MNKFTRALSALTAAAMLVSLAACSGSNSSSSSSASSTAGSTAPSTSSADGSSSAAPEQEKERELLTITGYFPMHASSALEDIPADGWMLDKMYEEKFNIK